MQPRPLRTTVIGSYPFPGWLEFASQHLDQFGADDVAEVQDDAVSHARQVNAAHITINSRLDWMSLPMANKRGWTSIFRFTDSWKASS